jgi:hypothetical protein
MMRRPATLVLTLLALAGCAREPGAGLSSAEFMGQDEVETAARLLAIAADEDSATVRREQAVRALDRLGVKLAEGEDPLGDWRAALAPDGAPPLRGRLLGPAYRSGTLRPGESIETSQLFDGGKPARVTFSAAEQAPLAVTVEDSTNRQVCRTDPGNPRSCRWTPPYSARYEIRVENSGSGTIRYFMVIG